MPIVNGAYDAPTWNNNAPPAIDASELQDMCDTIETYGTQKADVDYVNTFVRPNLLDNWYFVGGGSQSGSGTFPINQRGNTSYSGNVYFIDRWKGNGNIGADILTSGLKVTATAGVTQVVQIIENSDDLKGMKVTLSALTSSGYLLKTTVTLPDSSPTSNTSIGTGTEVVNGYNLYVRASSGKFYVSILASSEFTSAGLTLAAVKLELGSTQTLAHQENGTWVLNEIPNYAEEIYKCRRYYYRIAPFGTDNYCEFATGQVWNTDAAVYIPTHLRGKPTVTYGGNLRLVVCDSSGFHVATDITNMSVGGSSTGLTKVTISSATIISYKGLPMSLTANNTRDAWIALSSEL